MSGPSPCVRGLVPGEEVLLGSGENLRDEVIWEALGHGSEPLKGAMGPWSYLFFASGWELSCFCLPYVPNRIH